MIIATLNHEPFTIGEWLEADLTIPTDPTRKDIRIVLVFIKRTATFEEWRAYMTSINAQHTSEEIREAQRIGRFYEVHAD